MPESLSELRAELSRLREVLRSFDGGDRAPSPPASLLQEIRDLERRIEAAFEEKWEPFHDVDGALIWDRLRAGSVTIFVFRSHDSPGDWACNVLVGTSFLATDVELDATTKAQAHRESVTRALSLLGRATRDLSDAAGLP